MNIVKECFEEHGVALMERLQGTGFSLEQARQLLPEAATSISDITQDTGVVKLVTELASDGPSVLLGKINANAIADKLDMDSGLVKQGLETIIPVVSEAITDKGDGILGAVSSLAGGSADDLINSAKKLFD